MTLSKEEKVQLAELFEQPAMKTIKKVSESKVIECAINALNSRTEAYTAEQRGFSQGVQWLYKQLKEVHSEVYHLEEDAKKK